MLSSRLTKYSMVLCCLGVIMVLSMAGSGLEAASKKKIRISETELQSELMAFADRLGTYLFQALRDYEQNAKPPELRPRIHQDATLTSISAFTIAADPNPGTALLDMVALVSMGRLIYANHWQPLYGESIEPVVASFVKGEREIWQLAARILDDGQQDALRELIARWRTANPHQTGFAYLRFGYMASESAPSAADKKKASGLFKSVEEATRQVEETRLMAERTTYLATRIPVLFGSLADFWVTDMVKNQEIKRLLGDIHRLSTIADELPKTIAQERAAAIEQTMQEINTWSRATIEQTMRGISSEREQTLKQFFSELSQVRQKTLDDLLAQEQKYSRLLEEMRATLQEGNQLLASATELAKLIPEPDPEQAEAAPAMDIEEYRAALTDVRATIRDLTELLKAVEQTAGSPVLDKLNQLILSSMDQAGRQGEELIDLSFKRGMLLTLFAVVCFLVAQLIFINIRKRLSG